MYVPTSISSGLSGQGKEIRMDSLAGMDLRMIGTAGDGEVQQEGLAALGEAFVEDFFADAQVAEYDPFAEGDGGQEAYPDGAGPMELEENLPAAPARIPDTSSEAGEFWMAEEDGQESAGEQGAEEPDEPEGGEVLEKPEGSEDSEAPEEPEDGLGEEPEEPEEEPEAESAGEPGEEKLHPGSTLKERCSTSDAAAEERRAEHEASEAKRRAEWEARQQAKKEAVRAQLERIRAMNDEELASESMKRVGTDTEKLTRRNMKECVSEYVQTACLEDAAFARQVMLPQKNMVRCFQYISRKAYEYVQDEMKANGIHPGREMTCYASDIPDGLCYHWAEEYFRTMDVKEDEEEEEKFVPKPYMGKGSPSSSSRKPAGKRAASPKTGKTKAKAEDHGGKSGKGVADGKTGDRPDGRAADRRQKAADDGQLSFIGQMTFSDFEAQEVKAG